MRFVWVMLVLSAWAEGGAFERLSELMRAQRGYESVEVRFRQTKDLPALAQPVKTTGKLWLVPGERFRWEVGEPAEEVTVFDGSEVQILRVDSGEVETLSPSDRKVKALLLMLGMNGGGAGDFEKTFRISGSQEKGDHFIAVLVPKSGRVRRFLSSVTLQLNEKSKFLERVEWVQGDGSVVKTEFFPPEVGGEMDPSLFLLR